MNNVDRSNTTSPVQNDISEHIGSLFSQLDSQQVEQFYQGYQRWQQQQHIAALYTQLEMLEKQITDNAVLMQVIQPSPIALATLTRLQSYGVDDVDLLDTMLERGDTWLDHTLQLLEHCERLDLIHDNYTEWCQHALEGAYDWIDSMNEASTSPPSPPLQEPATNSQDELFDEETEVLLLQKLMSDDETIRAPAVGYTQTNKQCIEIPSILSYTTAVEASMDEPAVSAAKVDELREEEVVPSPSLVTTRNTKRHKSPGSGIVSRILAKAWQV